MREAKSYALCLLCHSSKILSKMPADYRMKCSTKSSVSSFLLSPLPLRSLCPLCWLDSLSHFFFPGFICSFLCCFWKKKKYSPWPFVHCTVLEYPAVYNYAKELWVHEVCVLFFSPPFSLLGNVLESLNLVWHKMWLLNNRDGEKK